MNCNRTWYKIDFIIDIIVNSKELTIIMNNNDNPIIICIPRMETSYDKTHIWKIFTTMNIGKVESIHEIPLQNNPNYKRIVVKITWDLQNPLANRIHSILQNNKTVKLVHNAPWYWICVKYAKNTQKTKSLPNPEMMRALDS